MSEKKDNNSKEITHVDVALVFSNIEPWGEDKEKLFGDPTDPYINVSKAIKETRDLFKSNPNITFDKYIEKVNMCDFIIDDYNEIKNGFYRTKKIQGKQYQIKNIEDKKYTGADDYAFVWLLNYYKGGITAELYDSKARCSKVKEGFYDWFVNAACNSNPGQKWHLFECILYAELDGVFGILGGGDSILYSLDKSPLWSDKRFKSARLFTWMADKIGCIPDYASDEDLKDYTKKKDILTVKNSIIERIYKKIKNA